MKYITLLILLLVERLRTREVFSSSCCGTYHANVYDSACEGPNSLQLELSLLSEFPRAAEYYFKLRGDISITFQKIKK
jgi:hypothetical protein